jgi:hypothetical protein
MRSDLISPATPDRKCIEARHVGARVLIRKMHGGCQAGLVLTDSGWYVVKWLQNPQHRRVLANEAIAAELLHCLGIASPAWAIVDADRGFLDANPDARISMRSGTIPIKVGGHFGSKVPVNPHKQAIFDFVPRHVLMRLSNLADFLRVYVFDHWVDNRDGRQAIFYRSPHLGITAQMIDNGCAFGFDGSEWRMRDRPVGREHCRLPELYCSAEASREFDRTIAQIQRLAEGASIEAAWKAVPQDWTEGDKDAGPRLLEELRRRARRVPDMVCSAQLALS